MTDSFAGFRCWTASRVQESVFGDIAQLGLDADAVFLAAHTSLEIRHTKGVHVDTETPEQEVLHSLTAAFGLPSENTIIAVTGASGSGKSHLVRWLRAHLSDTDERYHLIYVPRELATLRDLIGRILDGLPPSEESTAVREELEKAVSRKSPDQLAEELLDRLRSVITFELSNAPDAEEARFLTVLLGPRASDGTHRRENGLGDLLLMRALRNQLLRPNGGIRRIVDSLRGQRSGRDEELPKFAPEDLALRPQDVQNQVEANLRNVWRVVQDTPDAACAILNLGLPRAVAEVLGMRPSGANLGEVFRKARAQLHEEGKDLVLLFEDLAQFGLFDGELFDQFVLQPGATLAPVRAVFAITDGKFRENVPDTVRTRLAHHFEIVDFDAAGAPLAMLLGRYLNVARVGRKRLVTAWSAANPEERESGRWVPNECSNYEGGGRPCPHRETCFPSFGDSGGFGLYPYNPTAIRRAVSGSREPVTPRVVVDSFVHDFLLEADPEIARKKFPTDRVRDRFDFSVALPKDEVVPPAKLPEDERNRLHRARVIWADGAVEAPGITEAFSLPHLGGTTIPLDVPYPESPEPPRTAPRPQPLRPLFDWESGAPLPSQDAVFYRETLYHLATSHIDLNSLLIDTSATPALSLLRRVVTPNSFEFTKADPGRRAGTDQLRFEILPNGEGVRLLSAVRWYWDHGHWDITDSSRKWDFVGDIEAAQIELEEFIDGCARQIEGALVDSLTGAGLEPAAAAVALRALALRALGRELPAGPRALDFVLSQSAGSTAASAEWASASNAAQAALGRINRSWIEAFATARQGDTGAPQAVDAARLMPALETAKDDPLALLSPEATFDEAFSDLQQEWDHLRNSLQGAAEAELESLAGMVDLIVDRLAGVDVTKALPEIKSAGKLAADNGVFRPLNRYAAFATACDRLAMVSADDLRSWTDQRKQFGGGSDAVGAALAAQPWAARAGTTALDLVTIADCLRNSTDEVNARLRQLIGETPEELEGHIRTKVGGLSEKIAQLSDER